MYKKEIGVHTTNEYKDQSETKDGTLTSISVYVAVLVGKIHNGFRPKNPLHKKSCLPKDEFIIIIRSRAQILPCADLLVTANRINYDINRIN